MDDSWFEKYGVSFEDIFLHEIKYISFFANDKCHVMMKDGPDQYLDYDTGLSLVSFLRDINDKTER